MSILIAADTPVLAIEMLDTTGAQAPQTATHTDRQGHGEVRVP